MGTKTDPGSSQQGEIQFWILSPAKPCFKPSKRCALEIFPSGCRAT